jgi:hemoglobin
MTPPAPAPSLQPDTSAEITARTGLTPERLRAVVHELYARIRRDPNLAPIFADRITDWGPHLDRMVAFWGAVALMTGGYHGRPREAHEGLPVDRRHFARWLEIFSATARDLCTPAGADHLIERAALIADTLHRHATETARPAPPQPPR